MCISVTNLSLSYLSFKAWTKDENVSSVLIKTLASLINAVDKKKILASDNCLLDVMTLLNCSLNSTLNIFVEISGQFRKRNFV